MSIPDDMKYTRSNGSRSTFIGLWEHKDAYEGHSVSYCCYSVEKLINLVCRKDGMDYLMEKR